MSTARTWSVALTGADGHVVEVEADLSSQTPEFRIIGLPDKSLGEAVQRVHNACTNAGLPLPRRRLTVNLSPASLPKHGSAFDLAIAVSALAASDVIARGAVRQTVHLGELGLDGRLRPVPGVLPAVFAAARARFDRVIVPAGNATEAALVPGIEVRAASSLAEVAAWHGAEVDVPEVEPVAGPTAPEDDPDERDLSDVVGQEEAVEALIVAAAGGHHMLLSGPPGAGKTMLAARLPGIMPPLTEQEAIEVASMRSLCGEAVSGLGDRPPLVTPHHSASVAAIVGGGSRTARPGAVARAHRGVLFLDEAAEFSRVALDALRQPLETGFVDVHRSGFVVRFPARFQLLLAMNPCPCGNRGVRDGDCSCAPQALRRYATRLSGPLRDRIDIDLPVSRVGAARSLAATQSGVTSELARERVSRARSRAAERWRGMPWRRNADIPGTVLRHSTFRLSAPARAGLDRALERGVLTLRGYDRVLRVAWTMADLAGRARPEAEDVGRALLLRTGVVR
ncbi:YifB family Mg chelatase-like AAA ATPase [Microbacterium sp. BLY]|uniref:YifB family Mg chelatase-like AAA ATPase n=1 Tax=Microbacterium sp. BLY TaxID=2823280 RepID=UPI001B338541|nr:YifB family Mg chelatase-like AAA ATPase [Microbacterium sp. BLY]MBP3978299.1 YifB family Mg chelatase-like AAA ATPase [Microbacterium sp. BLY]